MTPLRHYNLIIPFRTIFYKCSSISNVYFQQVTAAKFSPSGCYIASGDVRGKLRVWAYDNDEHLCRLELDHAMTGAIRDISWDMDSKRLCLVGDGAMGASGDACVQCKVIQYDTGVTCGTLGSHK